jgi:hypothetical protein
MLTMMDGMHPTGITVDIVGIHASNNGRSCEKHLCCGDALQKNDVVRFRLIQVIVEGQEESALAAHVVSDGVDQCCVGFLRRHLAKHYDQYDGKLAQVVDIFSNDTESPSDRMKFHRNNGCCRAVMIEIEKTNIATPTRKRKAMEDNSQVDQSKK